MIIGNGRVITWDEENPFIENGAVLIKECLIVKVGTFEALKKEFPDEKVHDVRGRLVMPGMINAHTHIYSAFARGLSLGKPAPHFLEILENMWWHIDKNLTLEDTRYSAYGTLSESIRLGVTTVIDHHASPNHIRESLFTIGDVARELGIRACLCYETSDRDGEKIASEGIRENIEFIRAHNKDTEDMQKGLFGMHASFTLSDRTLEKSSAQMQGLDAGYHIHVAEGIDDETLCLKEHGKRVVNRLNDFGILGGKTLAVHCVHADDNELELLRETDTSIVHNPESNMGNAVGASPVSKMIQKGLRVGLGTDAYTSDMFESLKVAKVLQAHTTGDATVGFGEAMKMQFTNNREITRRIFNRDLGILRAGACADIITLDYNPLTPMTRGNIQGHVLFGMSGYQVNDTMINGKFVMKDRILLTLDFEKTMAKSREVSSELWKRL